MTELTVKQREVMEALQREMTEWADRSIVGQVGSREKAVEGVQAMVDAHARRLNEAPLFEQLIALGALVDAPSQMVVRSAAADGARLHFEGTASISEDELSVLVDWRVRW